MTLPSLILDITEARRAAKRAALLTHTRTCVPERRHEVRYGNDILWRRNSAHLDRVLEAKALQDINKTASVALIDIVRLSIENDKRGSHDQ